VITSALFLLVLSSKRIVQESHQVDDLLYGSAILVTNAQLMTMLWVAAAILLVHVLFFKELVFISFDSEMAQTLGYRTQLWNALLFATLGIGVSFSVRTLGALPVFGFLVIPGAVAQLLVRRVVWAFVWAVAIALMAGILGYYLAFSREWPTGPALVTSAALFLIPATLFRAIWKRA
jgi:zinc transport system permease protein